MARHRGVLSIKSFVCWSAGPPVVHPSLNDPKNTHYFLGGFLIRRNTENGLFFDGIRKIALFWDGTQKMTYFLDGIRKIAHILAEFGNRNSGKQGIFHFDGYLTDIVK